MKRVIVDYAKLTNEILNLLVERFPEGYDDSDIIRFRNAKNELIEAVEVKTEDTIYLVKVSLKLADRIENHEDDDEDIDDVIEPIIPIKGLDLDDDDDDDDDDTNDNLDKNDDGDDDDDDEEQSDDNADDEDFDDDED